METLKDWLEAGMIVAFILFIAFAAVSLYRVHKDKSAGSPNLLDLLTATDKKDNVRFDARKCWEAGAFFTSSWVFIYLTITGKLTEWFFIGYMAAWVVARAMRDREHRLGNGHAPAVVPPKPSVGG